MYVTTNKSNLITQPQSLVGRVRVVIIPIEAAIRVIHVPVGVKEVGHVDQLPRLLQEFLRLINGVGAISKINFSNVDELLYTIAK